MTLSEINALIEIVGAAAAVPRDHDTDIALLGKRFPQFAFSTVYRKPLGYVIVAKTRRVRGKAKVQGGGVRQNRAPLRKGVRSRQRS